MEPLDEEHFPKPLREALGFRRVVDTDAQQGAVTLAFEPPPQFLHTGGTTVQGGIVGAWIDHAMAWAVYVRDR